MFYCLDIHATGWQNDMTSIRLPHFLLFLYHGFCCYCHLHAVAHSFRLLLSLICSSCDMEIFPSFTACHFFFPLFRSSFSILSERHGDKELQRVIHVLVLCSDMEEKKWGTLLSFCCLLPTLPPPNRMLRNVTIAGRKCC